MLLLVALAQGADQAEYSAKYGTRTPSASELAVINRCLGAWTDHPFTDPANEEVRVIQTSVRVMGFGGGEPQDTLATDQPQLVLIQPAISAVSRTTYRLENPNGWYCFNTTTTVLGQNRMHLACGAQLANSRDGIAILGDDETSSEGGVVVLSEIEVYRGACD